MNLHHSPELLDCMIGNLPYQRHRLERIGCDQITPFVLALSEWPGGPVETGKDGKEPSAGDRQLFIALHLAACKLLGVQPHAPDLRPAWSRTREELEALVEAYRWAGAAQASEADELEALGSATP